LPEQTATVTEVKSVRLVMLFVLSGRIDMQ